MRAVRKSGDGIALVEVPRPRGEGVRVRVRSAGICGSDLHMVRAGFPLASTLGHEIAGETDDGTAVAIEPLRPCGGCRYCDAGDYNLCVEGARMVIGVALDGGMAEEIRVPERCLVPLHTGIPVADACVIEPLAVAIHGLRRAGHRPDQRVAVIGGGSIGLCAVAAIASSGAEVGLSARHDAQREAGARLGAREVDGSYPLVVDAAGTPQALAQAVELCQPGGSLLLLGTYWEGFELPGLALCMKEVNVVPSAMYGRSKRERDIDVAARILGEHPEIASALITHRFPLEGAVEAFEAAADRASGAIKVVLEP